jgi:hypothetical protein
LDPELDQHESVEFQMNMTKHPPFKKGMVQMATRSQLWGALQKHYARLALLRKKLANTQWTQ